MRRSFVASPVDEVVVLDILDLARRAPAAGNAAAVSFLLLYDDAVQQYWEVTLPGDRRDAFAWPALLDAPYLVLIATEPQRYVHRYSESDKSGTGLGTGTDAWTVPYWFVDAGCVVQNVLLLATEAGLGALFFGVFEHEPAVRAAFDIPDDVRLVGAIALGAASAQERLGRSADRARPALEEILHRKRW